MTTNTNYLFIDGAYLDEVIGAFASRALLMDTAPVDHKKLSQSFTKTFYYNCPPPQKVGETDVDWDARAVPYFQRMDALAELPGWHVFHGTTKRYRKRGAVQKEVDVQLAVDLLTHSFRKNMSQATLLAGDVDFRPAVEAATREGMYVTLWSERATASKELRAAADSRLSIEHHHIALWISNDSPLKKTLPVYSYSSGNLPENGKHVQIATLPNNQKFWLGKVHSTWIMRSIERDEHGYETLQHERVEDLKNYFERIYSAAVWSDPPV